MSIPINKDFQKLEISFAYQSEILVFGIPWSLKISLINISTMFIALKADLTGIKFVVLLRLSTIAIMESFCFLVLGNPVIKSIVIVSHFHFGIGIGCNNIDGSW